MARKAARICISCLVLTIIMLQLIAGAYYVEYFKLPAVDRFINNCGKNYFYSLILIKENDYNFSDVSGCKDNYKGLMTCIYSIKNSNQNPFYSKVHHLDKKTLKYLNSKTHNEITYIADVNQVRRFGSINKILLSTKSSIESVWFKTIKISSKVRKLHIITTSKSTEYCNNKASEVIRGI